jgi:hypothetical protein
MDFYDRNGRAVAYLADEEHIHDWDGRPSAFVRNGTSTTIPADTLAGYKTVGSEITLVMLCCSARRRRAAR